MPIDIQETTLPFTRFNPDVALTAKFFPEKKIPDLLRLEMALGDILRANALLCELRANNISVLVDLKKNEGEVLSLDQAVEAVVLLRDWDQLTLQNVLELFAERFPEKMRTKLQIESKIESKSFREWVLASQDSRIHKYPGLPWRSFIRKIVKENFSFILNCIQLWDNGSDEKDFEGLFGDFIEAKKKVVCVFPKKWS